MAIATTCPSCDALFRVADELAHKKVKCKKCSYVFIVPDAGHDEPQPGLAVEVEDTAPPPVKRKVVRADDDDDGVGITAQKRPMPEAAPRPAGRRRKTDDEDENGGARRKDDDLDDDEEDRPRRKRLKKRRKTSTGASPLTIVLSIIGGVLLTCCGTGVYWGISIWNVANEIRHLDDLHDQPRQPIAAEKGIQVNLGPNNMFRHDAALTLQDPLVDLRRVKTYTIHMEPGKSYQIDMMSKQLDAYLYLIDDANQVVASDDDGGNGLDARIIFSPTRAGVFRIEATTFADGAMGPYTLQVTRR